MANPEAQTTIPFVQKKEAKGTYSFVNYVELTGGYGPGLDVFGEENTQDYMDLQNSKPTVTTGSQINELPTDKTI